MSLSTEANRVLSAIQGSCNKTDEPTLRETHTATIYTVYTVTGVSELLHVDTLVKRLRRELQSHFSLRSATGSRGFEIVVYVPRWDQRRYSTKERLIFVALFLWLAFWAGYFVYLLVHLEHYHVAGAETPLARQVKALAAQIPTVGPAIEPTLPPS